MSWKIRIFKQLESTIHLFCSREHIKPKSGVITQSQFSNVSNRLLIKESWARWLATKKQPHLLPRSDHHQASLRSLWFPSTAILNRTSQVRPHASSSRTTRILSTTYRPSLPAPVPKHPLWTLKRCVKACRSQRMIARNYSMTLSVTRAARKRRTPKKLWSRKRSFSTSQKRSTWIVYETVLLV